MPKVSLKDATTRVIDQSLTITDLINEPTFSFDLVLGRLAGDHPPVANRVSDRAYYILGGTGIINVGREVYEVSTGDAVQVPRGTPHSLRGEMQYLIITAPPFSPDNEEILKHEV